MQLNNHYSSNDINDTTVTPNGLDNDLGKEMPNGAIRPLKLAEKPEATKATAIKYSAKSAQPATHPNNSPKEH